MGPEAVVIVSPFFDFPSDIVKGAEPVGRQALIPELPIERFNIRVIGRLARSRELQNALVLICP